MNTRVSLILISLFSMVFSDSLAENYSPEALCGHKPETINEAQEREKIKKLEKDMPPIQNQSSAGWCSVFSTCDTINYNIHKANPSQKYSQDKLVSPIDAFYAAKVFLNQNSDPPLKNEPPVDLAEGMGQIDVVLGVQSQRKLRSLQQIHFNPLEDENPESVRLVEDLIAKDSARNGGPKVYAGINNDSCSNQLLPEINSFKVVNSWLQNEDQKLLGLDSHRISHYSAIAQTKGDPDLELPPIFTHGLTTSTPDRFLQDVRKGLDKDEPVTISVCWNKMFPEPSSDDCGPHALNIVGAGYINGKCSVRIRNTWGKGWEDGGYKTVPLDLFMVGASVGGSYVSSWIELSKTNLAEDTAVNWRMADGSLTTGSMHRDANRVALTNGNVTYLDGSISTFKDNKTVEVQNCPWPDKSRFSGTVEDHGSSLAPLTGSFVFPDDSSEKIKDGIRVFLQNSIWNEKDKVRYTGTLKDGSSPLDGVMTWPNGGQTTYKNGVLTDVNNFVLKGGIRFSGTVYPDGRPKKGYTTSLTGSGRKPYP